jgi:STELLO glycosyltransferases
MALITCLVVTSISGLTDNLQKIAIGCVKTGYNFILIGDEKGPKHFSLDGCDFYDIERQLRTDLKFATKCPRNHYARKNIGYLIAMQKGADIIIETDDDNIPYDSFWHERTRKVNAHFIKDAGWINVYSFFTDAHIWPRGFLLEKTNSGKVLIEDLIIDTIDCPIQQGLADNDPDVDAIHRLIFPFPVEFRTDLRIALGKSSWCPFNSQNTAWWPDTYPLLYLPSYCSFRMTDIWRSFIAQKICWINGWNILFHEPTVWQERNIHNLMQDFKDEIPGYINNALFCEELESLQLRRGVDNIESNLRLCYKKLIDLSFIKAEELDLLDLWLNDLIQIKKCRK